MKYILFMLVSIVWIYLLCSFTILTLILYLVFCLLAVFFEYSKKLCGFVGDLRIRV